MPEHGQGLSAVPAAEGIRTVAIIGAGAVGAFYGSKLQRSGLAVEYNSATMARTRVLNVSSIWGDYRLPIRAFAKTTAMIPADLVVVSLKALPEISVFEIIQPVLKPDSVILMLQNGINQEEHLADQFKRRNGSRAVRPTILGGLAFACINRTSPSHVEHLDYGLVKIGALNKLKTRTARRVVDLFNQAGILCEVAPRLRKTRYEKLLWNAAFNTLSVLLHATTEPIVRSANTADLSLRMMKEVQAVAAAEGIRLTASDIKGMLEKTIQMKPYRTSMLLDYESGRPMEVEAILGEVVRMASRRRVRIPHLKMAYDMLCFFDTEKKTQGKTVVGG